MKKYIHLDMDEALREWHSHLVPKSKYKTARDGEGHTMTLIQERERVKTYEVVAWTKEDDYGYYRYRTLAEAKDEALQLATIEGIDLIEINEYRDFADEDWARKMVVFEDGEQVEFPEWERKEDY